jgi:hypothetical protein
MWLKRQVSKVPPKKVPFHPTAHVTPQQQKTIAIHVNKTAPSPATKPRTISLHGVGQFVQGVKASGADLASQLSAGAFGAAVERSGTHHIGFGGGGGLTPSGVTSGASVPGAASFASNGGDAPTAYNAAGIPEAATNPADDWAAGGGGGPLATTASGGDELGPPEGWDVVGDEPGFVEKFLDGMTSPPGTPGPRASEPGYSTGAKVAVGGGIAAGVVAIAKLLF